ncbi:MAG: peptidyl-prolyl cis-trans isomerase [Treponema sp.]|nr:peptidyl-prolyl cis-trans isomerase [Treponema sp.]
MKRFFILVLMAACIAFSVYAQQDLQPVAIVRLTKSEPITVKQLRTEIEKLAWQDLAPRLNRPPTAAEIANAVQSVTPDQRKQILDVIINERLALQAADRDKVTVTDNELNQQIQQLRTQLAQSIGRQPTDDEFAQAIKNETGLDLPAFRDQLRRQSIVQKYLMSKKQDSFSSIKTPTDAEIVNAYNLAKAQFVRPDTVRFSMIQVPYGPDAASKAKAKDLADKLSQDIGLDPAKFDDTVIKGQSPNSGYQAGDGGYLPRNLQAQQAAGLNFINTAFSLKQGEVSPVIEGVQGYQIIKITETYAQKSLDLDDILQPGSRVTVRQYIGQNMLQQRQQDAVTKASAELITELRANNSFQVMDSNLNW